jgi:hypothetical protein
VIQTFVALLDRVYDRLDNQYSLGATHGLSRASFITATGGGS